MNRNRKRIASIAVVAALLVSLPTAAQAYRVTSKVTTKSLLAATGVSGVYKSHKVVAGGKTFCVRASSNSGNDPGTADFTRIIVRSSGGQQLGGYGSYAVGDVVQADVLEGRSPTGCGGLPIATLMYVDR